MSNLNIKLTLMNWREELSEQFWDTPRSLRVKFGKGERATVYDLEKFIETQIIKKLIPDAMAKMRIMGPDEAGKALTAKWLINNYAKDGLEGFY